MFLVENFRLNTQRGTSVLQVFFVIPSERPAPATQAGTLFILAPAVTREQFPFRLYLGHTELPFPASNGKIVTINGIILAQSKEA